MNGYAVYEVTPAPWGYDYRFICLRETREQAYKVLEALYETDVAVTSVYKIVKHGKEIQ